MNHNIIPLEREQWQSYKLPFHYISHNYYDKLFQPHWDDVKAWGIVEDGRLLAAIETSVEGWSNRLRVTELWIDDAYRRQGIGTALMNMQCSARKTKSVEQ